MAKFNQPDPRNDDTRVWVNGLVHRAEAKVSVLDSVVQGGDAVWEGLRILNGRALQLNEHISRLLDSAHALSATQRSFVRQGKAYEHPFYWSAFVFLGV